MKYFLSLLGTGNYQPGRYVWAEKISPTVRYVQTASLLRTGAVDRVLLFCTKKAKETHWGPLCEEFRNQGCPEPECVDIEEGLTEDGMWNVFSKVVGTVPEKAEIVFDATHSFRSLSILMSIMLNYLKVVKGVVLRACYYGAWEAKNEDGAPLVDLQPFFELNDWTIALRDFTELGDATEMNRLARASVLPGLRDDEDCRQIRDLAKEINCYTDNVRVNRLGDADKRTTIVSNAYDGIPEKLVALRESPRLPLPMKPILDEIAEPFRLLRDFSKGSEELAKGLVSAQWACGHGLIPQGYTLLEESIISHVKPKLDFTGCTNENGNPLSEIEKRESVSSLLNGKSLDKGRAILNGRYRKMAEPFGGKLEETFRNLGNDRNMINHAGTGNNSPFSKTEFQNRLSEFIREFARMFRIEIGESI